MKVIVIIIHQNLSVFYSHDNVPFYLPFVCDTFADVFLSTNLVQYNYNLNC